MSDLCNHDFTFPSECVCPDTCHCKTTAPCVKKEKQEMMPDTNILVDSRQPAPIPNDSPDIKDLVAKDFADRAEFGKTKYGVYLQANNGRDGLKDLYQEQLDAIMYTRLLLFQRDGH